jgi:hypothetical protein
MAETILKDEHEMLRPGLGRLKDKVAIITGANSGHRPRDGTVVRARGSKSSLLRYSRIHFAAYRSVD